MDALRSKVATLESSLASSQMSCTQLQQDMSESKQQHSLAIGRLKEEAVRLTSQVRVSHSCSLSSLHVADACSGQLPGASQGTA